MESKNYFDQVARDWDEMRMGFFSDDLRKKAIERAAVSKDETAIDAGAGSGFMTEALLKEELRVIAIDESLEMLEVLKSKFGEKITIIEGGAEHLPVEDNAVDHVFANMLLHHVENPGIAIREFYRVLKPSGKLIITDLDKHDREFLAVEQHDRWLGFERGKVIQWLEKAGFNEIEIDSADEKCCASSECSDAKAELSIFMAYGSKDQQQSRSDGPE